MRTENVVVSEPCHADWNAMTGDERKRFCGRCDKHVYDLSAMTREEAAATVATGRCVQYRADARGNLIFRPAAAAAVALLATTPAVAAPPVVPAAGVAAPAASEGPSLLERFVAWWRGETVQEEPTEPVEVEVEVETLDTGIAPGETRPPRVRGRMVFHPPSTASQPAVTTPSTK